MRRANLWWLALGGVLLAGGLVAALSAGGEPAASEVKGKKPRDFFPRNPLVYVELRGLGELEAKLAGFKLWADGEAAKKEVAKLTGLAAKQLSLLAGHDKPDVGRKIMKQVKSLHVAIYPPASFPPELLIAAEVTDPAELVKLLSGGGAARKLGPYRGAELYLLNFSMNGIRKTTAAAVAGKLVLLSPYRLRLRQALDVAADGEGALKASPGFADCAKRFSSKPLWGYINATALASVGALDDMMVEEAQGVLVAMGLPSYRWAGFGSALGAGKTPFEFHLEYFKWSPLAGLAPPAGAPDPSLAAAAPADVLFFAAMDVGDPVKAWKAVKARIERAAPDFAVMDGEDFNADAGKKVLKEMDATLKMTLGLSLEKDLVPALSGNLACFFAGGDDFAFGLVLGARNEESARKLMARMKVKDGTVGAAGGDEGDGEIYVARIGKNILLADNEDLAKNTVAAVAARKTLGASKAYQAQMAALGGAQGLVTYFPAGRLRKMLEAEGEGFAKLLAKDYAAASCLSLTETGLTWRSTGPVEAAALLPMLAGLDGIVRDMERNAARRRMESIAAAANAFARKNPGRWPVAFEELGAAFRAGSPARRSPASGKDFVLVGLGKVPPKASRYSLVLCYEPGAKGYCQAVCVRGGRAYVNSLSAKAMAALIRNTPGILAVADPSRVKLTAAEQKTAADAAKDLGSDDFPKRDAATRKLRGLGLKAVPGLVKLVKSSDPEVANRAEMLLKELIGLRNAAEIRKLAP